ncbi:MAG: tetratricopeptide repeat protein [Phycisphaerales bacterium]|nr:MAG: tetratricopeptide repeat protein [Phycisphaerales bacterium]
MDGRTGVYRVASRLPLALSMALAGCATSRTTEPTSRAGELSAPAADVDPARAYLALADIQPAVVAPAPADPARPLSERAARQLAQARRLADQQRYTEASIELQRGLRYDPNHPETHRALALLNWEASNLQRALDHASRALQSNPDDALAYYVKGRCHAAEKSHESAIKAFRTALLCTSLDQHRDYAALCHYYLAASLSEEGYLEAALQQYSKFASAAAALNDARPEDRLAVLLKTNIQGVPEARSRIFEKLGRYSEAAEALAPQVARMPDDVPLAVRYAGLLLSAGRFDDAGDAARAIPSDDQMVMQLISRIHELAGHPERTIDDLYARLALRPDEPRIILVLADALLRFGRPDEAREELEAYLERNEDVDPVRAKLVDVLLALSAYSDAISVAADWITRSPERSEQIETLITSLAGNPEATAGLLDQPAIDQGYAVDYLRGVLAYSAKRMNLAERLLRASLSKNEDFVLTRVALARVYMHQYRYSDALEVTKLDEEGVAREGRLERLRGDVEERLDNLDAAEVHYRAAIQLNRADTETMFALAGIHIRNGHRLQAVRQLRVLLEEDPLHESAREALALTLLREGDITEAVEQFERLVELAATPTVKARCEAFLAQLEEQDPEKYRQTLRQTMEQTREDAETWLAIAESYDRFDEGFEARDAYANALAIDPDSEEAALGLMQAEMSLLDFEEAVRRLEALLPRRPNRHAWRLELIDLYWTIQDYDAALSLSITEEARDDLSEVTQQRYRAAILATLRLLGHTEEVLARLQEWADVEPENARWANLLAREYLRQDRAEEAVAVYQAMLEREPDSLFDLIDALVAAGQHVRASQYVLDRLDDDPDSDNIIALLADTLSRAGQTDDAIELVRNKLLHTLNREFLQIALSRLLNIADRHEESIDFIEELIDEVFAIMHPGKDQDHGGGQLSDDKIIRQPDQPFTMSRLHTRLHRLNMELARSLIAAEDYREAQKRLESWIDQTREAAKLGDYLYLLANCHQLQGDEPRAYEVYEQVLAIIPDDVSLNNNVAYGWIDRGIRLEEAEQLVRYAIFKAPRQAAYLDTFGWLQYKKGAFVEAKKWLERAERSLSDPDPVVLDHLGDANWRLGEAEKAIEYWSAAVAALEGRDENQLLGDDVQNVRNSTPKKIDDARAGAAPGVAPLAAVESSEDSTDEAVTP